MRILEKASSEIVPAADLGSRLLNALLIANFEPIEMMITTATTVDERMSVSFHDWENATAKAATSVNIAVNELPTLVEVPFKMVLMSEVMRFVISPLPRLSKKAIF